MKDELISGVELAKRLDVTSAYITKQKKLGKLTGCIYNKKYYFIRTCKALGKNPDNPQAKKQTIKKQTIKKQDIPQKQVEKNQTKKTEQKQKKESIKNNINKSTTSSNENEDDPKMLLNELMVVINDKNNVYDKLLLDGMKLKASMLKEYFLAKNEELKNRKQEENLFTKDEVVQVLSAAMSMIRNAMINMPNNYAVNLENEDKTTIKEYVTDDINKILSDLQSVGEQFEKSNI